MILALLLGAAALQAPEGALTPIPAERVQLRHEFFTARTSVNQTVTIPLVLARCEEAGAISNFAAAAAGKGEARGGPLADAEVYRALEAIGWTLAAGDDTALGARADALIEQVAAAQAADGYLHTPTQLAGGERWGKSATSGELECAGQLFEAGVAYARGAGKTKLLDVALRLAARLEQDLAAGQIRAASAGGGVELGLARLAAHTQDARWVRLGEALLALRGDLVAAARFDQGQLEPGQAALLCAGVSELALLGGAQGAQANLERLWAQARGLTSPAGGLATRGCETCAGLAFARWSHAMQLLTADAQYGDVVERALYNLLPAATNLAGDRFLHEVAARAGSAEAAGAAPDCCAGEVARFWPRVAEFVFAQKGNTLYQLQLATAGVDLELAGARVKVRITCDLPASGRMEAATQSDKAATWNVKLRKPSWCQDARVMHDLKEQEHELHDHEQGSGWVPFERQYEPTDGWRIHFLAPVRRTSVEGGTVLWRGPLLYCLEGTDNRDAARALSLPEEAELKVEDDGRILGRTRVIRARGRRAGEESGVPSVKPATLTAIPYCLRGNRGASDLVVVIPALPQHEASGGR